jgi:hypothetical protein
MDDTEYDNISSIAGIDDIADNTYTASEIEDG